MTENRTENLSGVPLSSLSAICLDTETTGLDTSVARIVQLGAVKITAGRVDEEESFNRLVNPGVPIPASSSLIHNIDDRTISDAEPFPVVFSDLSPLPVCS